MYHGIVYKKSFYFFMTICYNFKKCIVRRNTVTNVGKKIKEQRIRKGLTQSELAQKLNVESSTISSWERGENNIKAPVLKDVAIVLDISSDELLGINSNKDIQMSNVDEYQHKKSIHQQLSDDYKLLALYELIHEKNTKIAEKYFYKSYHHFHLAKCSTEEYDNSFPLGIEFELHEDDNDELIDLWFLELQRYVNEYGYDIYDGTWTVPRYVKCTKNN